MWKQLYPTNYAMCIISCEYKMTAKVFPTRVDEQKLAKWLEGVNIGEKEKDRPREHQRGFWK